MKNTNRPISPIKKVFRMDYRQNPKLYHAIYKRHLKLALKVKKK